MGDNNPAGVGLYIALGGGLLVVLILGAVLLGVLVAGPSETGKHKSPTPKASETKTPLNLSLEEQKDLFWKAVKRIDDQAMREADKRYPTSLNCVSASVAKSNIEKNAELQNELRAKYEERFLKEHNLTENQLDKITVKGAKNRWPTPDPPSGCP